MTAYYIPDGGMYVSIQGQAEGVSVLLGEWMTVGAIEHYVRELVEYYG